MSTKQPIVLLAALLCSTSANLVGAQSTAFTYQGFLTEQGAPAAGVHDFEFRLFNAPAGGTQQGGVFSVENHSVSNGLFTVALDFGTGVFDGGDRWLNIAVRPGDSVAAHMNLLPRQPITRSPYAIAAGRVLENGLASGEYSEKMIFSNPGNSFVGDGGGVSNLVADALGSGTLPDARLSGNVARRDTANTFVGNQIVNGSLGVRTSPNADLHVRGAGTNGMVLITPNVSDSRSQLMLSENTSGSLGMVLQYRGDQGANPLHIVGRYTGGIETELLTVERFGGNVGVGTNDPAFKLHVVGSLQIIAGGTTLTVNPDGSVAINSASTVSIDSAGDVAINSGRNLALTSSNLAITVARDMVLDVGRTLSISNRFALWSVDESLALIVEDFSLDVEDNADFTADNINFNARSNVNMNATGDVIIKGSKINEN